MHYVIRGNLFFLAVYIRPLIRFFYKKFMPHSLYYTTTSNSIYVIKMHSNLNLNKERINKVFFEIK